MQWAASSRMLALGGERWINQAGRKSRRIKEHLMGKIPISKVLKNKI